MISQCFWEAGRFQVESVWIVVAGNALLPPAEILACDLSASPCNGDLRTDQFCISKLKTTCCFKMHQGRPKWNE
jgi:hypothetical protein